MPLVINALRVDTHTHRHTYQRVNKNNFKKPLNFLITHLNIPSSPSNIFAAVSKVNSLSYNIHITNNRSFNINIRITYKLLFLPGIQETASQTFGTDSQEIFHFEVHTPAHTPVHTQHTSSPMHVAH